MEMFPLTPPAAGYKVKTTAPERYHFPKGAICTSKPTASGMYLPQPANDRDIFNGSSAWLATEYVDLDSSKDL